MNDLVSSPGSLTSDVTFSAPDLTNLFSSVDLLGNDLNIISQIDTYLTALETLLSGQLFGQNIPLVGNALKSAGTFLQPVENAINTMQSITSIDQMQTVLFDALGPSGANLLQTLTGSGGGAGAGSGSGGGTTPTQQDVQVEYMLTNTSTFVPFSGGTPPSPQTIQDIQVDLNLGGTQTIPLPINGNLGLPGLGLSVSNGTVDVTLGWTLTLDFGIDRNGSIGAYIVTPSNSSSSSADVLSVNLSATLSTGAELTAQLGFLAVTATQPDPTKPDPYAAPGTTGNALASGVTLSAGVGFSGGSASVGGMSVTPIASGGGSLPNVNVNFSATAAIDFDLALGFDIQNGGIDPNYPSFQAQLLVGGSGTGATPWTIDFNSQNPSATQPAAPSVSLNNIEFNFGDFLNNYVTGILKPIAQALKPIQPVLNFLNTQVPLFNESLIDFIGSLSGGEVQNVAQFISFVSTVANYTQYFNGGSGPLMLSLGSFNLDQFDLRQAPGSVGGIPNTGIPGGYNTLLTDLQSVAGALNFNSSGAIQAAADGADASFSQFMSNTDGSITFPVLDDPKSLIGLLFGQQVVLVHVTAPELVASAGFEIDIPVWDLPPIEAVIKGSIGIDLRFAAGYDTYGLTEVGAYLTSTKSPSASVIALDLLDGLYFDDTPTMDALGAMEPATSVSILGNVSLEADIGIPGLLSAGVGGGVTLTVTMSLKDDAPPNVESAAYYKANNNDNKTQIREFTDWIAVTGDPLCAFNLNGAVSFQLYLTESFFGFSATQTLLSATLFDFSLNANCYTALEPLGTQAPDGVVTLYTGPLWQQRDVYTDSSGDIYTGASPPSGYTLVKGPTAEGGDNFTVTQLSPGSILVTAPDGAREAFSGVNNTPGILGVTGLMSTLGVGQNELQVKSALTETDGVTLVPETIIGGTGNDTIIAGGGPDLIVGGGGDDLIKGGVGSDTIYAGTTSSPGTSDGDTITGGSLGHNLIYGSVGADIITVSGPDNTVFGGPSESTKAGYSVITGTGGGNLLVGGTGDDVIQGGGGGNTIIGGGGNNLLIGGSGANLIYGGTDASYDTSTAELLFGTPPATPSGQNWIFGGSPSLALLQKYGNESAALALGLPVDTLPMHTVSGDGNDEIHAGPNGDQIFGGEANNTIFGGTGPDTIIGGPAFDTITGGGGDESILGRGTDFDLRRHRERYDLWRSRQRHDHRRYRAGRPRRQRLHPGRRRRQHDPWRSRQRHHPGRQRRRHHRRRQR